MRRIALLLLLLFGAANGAYAADDPLAALSQSLVEVRKTHGVNDLRNAGPELTPVKQRLRAWVEGFLPPESKPGVEEGSVILPSAVDLKVLSGRLSKMLEDRGMTCGYEAASVPACPGASDGQEDDRGYLGGINLSTADSGRYLVVTTAVGIRCGYDESVYVYKRGPDRKWMLLFENEEDRYGKDEYNPKSVLSVDVSPAGVAWNDPAPPPLIMVLGQYPWCSSAWQGLYTRLWRASETTTTPKPLLDRNDTLYIGDYEVASARLTAKDAVIEFKGRSIDGGVLIRSHVLHYQVLNGDRLKRIAPVALSPNDFTEEWLDSPWSEAAGWLDPKAKGVVTGKIHQNLKASFGEFDGPATRCRSDQTLWQVTFAATNEHSKDYDLLPPNHFLIRWMAPYRFSLVALSRKQFTGCDQKVSMPDDLGTLFPSTDGKEQ